MDAENSATPAVGPIAIDGPAAAGKTTVGKALAERFGFTFVDTGLMYRAFTLAALREGLSADDAEGCRRFAASLPLRVEPGDGGRIFLGEEEVTALLRRKEVEENVSAYSAISGVREAMVARQREMAAEGRAVLAGRDIGTVVLKDAPVKLFLTASEDERARRRTMQAPEWGAPASEADSRTFISGRDKVDSTRAASPLVPAEDAITIDTTAMSLEEVIAEAVRAVERASETKHGNRGRGQSRYPVETRKFRWGRFTPAFYAWGHYTTRFLLFLLTRYHCYGRENVPRGDGGLIIASNHLNNLDPPILSGAIPLRRRIRWMGKVELFRGPLFYIAHLWGAFPLRRFEADLGAMLNAERILRAGGTVGMFPEGTRSRSGQMAKIQSGTATIALHTGATILPVAITGTDKIRKPQVLLRRPPVTVRIGEPIQVERVRKPTPAQVSELTERIEAAIRALLPPVYGGSYTG